jgi:hypothetical protein
MKALGTFVVAVALIVGLVSCVYPPPFPEQYNLTISSTEGGSVTAPGEGTFTYWYMDVVELMAEADEGYQFVEWAGDVGSIADVNAANTTITMSDAYSIAANFVARYVLTIGSTDGGRVSIPGEGPSTYDAGAVVDIVAQPEEGYKFAKWTGDVDTIADAAAGTTRVTMNTDHSITANFQPDWIQNPTNGHHYVLTPPLTWMQAEAWAQEWGGHLVTLRNWEEELWIKDTFGWDEYFWIGFSDIEKEGDWVWSSGEPAVYSNWEEGEPNNCGGFGVPSPCYPEHTAVMNWAPAESPYGPGQFGDRWNDIAYGSLKGVAEMVPSDG